MNNAKRTSAVPELLMYEGYDYVLLGFKDSELKSVDRVFLLKNGFVRMNSLWAYFGRGYRDVAGYVKDCSRVDLAEELEKIYDYYKKNSEKS
jgi:hypothetical protein